jgi:hypothetical protein
MGPWDPAVIGPIAGAVMTVAIAFSVAGVMIFRPLTRQLGELLEQMRRDRQLRTQGADPARIAELMERILDRVERLEARQEFTEHVLQSGGWHGEQAPLSHGAGAERRGRAGETS